MINSIVAEADSSSVGQKIMWHLRGLNFHCWHHRRPPVDSILGQFIPNHPLVYTFC